MSPQFLIIFSIVLTAASAIQDTVSDKILMRKESTKELQAPSGSQVAQEDQDWAGIDAVRARYLDTVRDTLTGSILRTPSVPPYQGNADAASHQPFNEKARWAGLDWCSPCFTMAGGARVQNVRELVEKTVIDKIPGDFLETGTWRGGCSIMARVVQRLLGEGATRRTYVCDSFSGLPRSSQAMDNDGWSKSHYLEVSQSEVEDNFKQFRVLDSNVLFRKGFFSESLPKVRRELKEQERQLAVLRGDGDMYESYMDILYNLYDFVSVGGYFICDDCGSGGAGIPEANRAIEDFRKQHGISAPLQKVEGSAFGMFWRKEVASMVNYTKYLQWCSTRSPQAKPAKK